MVFTSVNFRSEGSGKVARFARVAMPIALMLCIGFSSASAQNSKTDFDSSVLKEIAGNDTVTVSAADLKRRCTAAIESSHAEANQLADIFTIRSRASGVIADYPSAATDAGEALRRKPNDPYLVFRQLMLQTNCPGVTEAPISAYRSFFDRFPRYAPAADLLAYKLDTIREFKEALKYADKAIELDPNIARHHCQRAEICCHLGDYESGVESCRRAIDLEPLMSGMPAENPYLTQGVCLFSMKKPRLEQSLSSFLMAVRLNPNSRLGRLGIYRTYHALGRYYVAKEAADALIRVAPDNYYSFFCLASSEMRLGRAEEAIAAARASLRLRADMLDTSLILAKCLMIRGGFAEAVEIYSSILEGAPEQLDSCIALSMIYSACPDPQFRDGAKSLKLAESARSVEAEKSLKLMGMARSVSEEKRVQVLAAMAWANAELGRYPEALRLTEKILATSNLSPTEVDFWKNTMTTYREMKPYRLKVFRNNTKE